MEFQYFEGSAKEKQDGVPFDEENAQVAKPIVPTVLIFLRVPVMGFTEAD